MSLLKIGDRAVHTMREGLGIGRVAHLYDDERCDMVFDDAKYSYIPLTSVRSVEADIRLCELDRLLESFEWDLATEYFHNCCLDYLSEAEFQERMSKVRTAQQAALIALEHTQLSQELNDLLDRGQFERADEFFVNRCSSWHSRPDYERERAARQAALIKLERAELSKNLHALLDRGEFERADKFYSDRCSSWYSRQDYGNARGVALRSRALVEVYAGASLQDLDRLYSDWDAATLTPAEFARLKLPKLRVRMARLGMPLDEEQLLACARPERHRLLSARAGSGKTRTLAAIAALAIHDESLVPDQVLILAFNTRAAREIGDRVRGAAGIDEFRSAKTFHSLAWHLANHAGRSLIFDDGNLEPSRQKQRGFVERILSSIVNPAFRELMYEFFRHELEQIDRLGSGLHGEEYLAFRRALTNFTLGGEDVKSNGEKFIADFLFEHDIQYTYEKVFSWDKRDRLNGGAYRPDFFLIHEGKDVVLEHWAIDPDDPHSQVPRWWETKTGHYRAQIDEKRTFWTERAIPLIETHAGMVARGRQEFESCLRSLLENAGIRCQKLPHHVLVDRVASAPRNVSRMSELFIQFISRAKKRGWSVSEVADRIQARPDPEPRNRAFNAMALRAYSAYAEGLVREHRMDFDDLLSSAADDVSMLGGAARIRLERNDSISLSELRWVLIDEFQDFSELYYRLIEKILQANPAIRVVSVGDDWQAINAFAGAQLKFFEDFKQFFPGAGEAAITVNRRSGRAILEAGNRLMRGKGAPARPSRDFDGVIRCVSLDEVWADDLYVKLATTSGSKGHVTANFDLARALKACADFIVDSFYQNEENGFRWAMPKVLLLARTGRAYNVSLEEFRKKLLTALRRRPGMPSLVNFTTGDARPYDDDDDVIQAMTAHKSKGKEADTVIVLDATSRQFPKVHADNQLFGLFDVTDADILEEERRLFYVAITRAEHNLMVLTESGNVSPYVKEITREDRALPRNLKDSVVAPSDGFACVSRLLDSSDQRELVRGNISANALRAWSRLQSLGLGMPVPGFSLSGSLHAELAWPEAAPPRAILTGSQEQHAELWRDQGWVPVLSSGSHSSAH